MPVSPDFFYLLSLQSCIKRWDYDRLKPVLPSLGVLRQEVDEEIERRVAAAKAQRERENANG